MLFKPLKPALQACVLFLLGGSGAWAAANLESVVGDVRATQAGVESVVRTGQRIETGTLMVTGAKSNAVLRFDDGQVAVLNQNTTFRITEYRFQENDPGKDKSVLELVRGALRFISGKLSKRTQEAVQIRTTTATIGIRGTDLMAVTGSLAVSVGEGGAVLTNAGGTLAVNAGQLGFVQFPGVLGGLVSSAQLPGAIASVFGELATIPVTGISLPASATIGYTPASGVAAATGGGALGGISGVALGAGAAAVAGVAAVVSNVNDKKDESKSTTSTTSTR